MPCANQRKGDGAADGALVFGTVLRLVGERVGVLVPKVGVGARVMVGFEVPGVVGLRVGLDTGDGFVGFLVGLIIVIMSMVIIIIVGDGGFMMHLDPFEPFLLFEVFEQMTHPPFPSHVQEPFPLLLETFLDFRLLEAPFLLFEYTQQD